MVEGGNAAIHRRRTGEADRDGDLANVDELFAPDHAVDGRHLGRGGVKDAVVRIKGARPDLTMDVEELVADGDRVVVRVLTRGTREGPFHGHPRTGRSLAVRAIMIYRLADRLIVEDHEAVDELGLLRQLAPCPSALPASSPSVQTPPERAITRRGGR